MIEQFGNATYMRFDPPHKIADLGNNFGDFGFLLKAHIICLYVLCMNIEYVI